MHPCCALALHPCMERTPHAPVLCAGGVSSPYFKLLQAANVHGMQLREGSGNVYVRGAPSEPDEINVVWVVDSNKLPFYRAEAYHQFHNGLGKAFGAEYTRDLKAQVRKTVLRMHAACVRGLKGVDALAARRLRQPERLRRPGASRCRSHEDRSRQWG